MHECNPQNCVPCTGLLGNDTANESYGHANIHGEWVNHHHSPLSGDLWSRCDDPLPERLFQPSFKVIFFHGLSVLDFGLGPGKGFKSPNGGVVGGVIGSPETGLDKLPESLDRMVEPESPLAVEL